MNKLFLYLKGFCMGVADVIPGVSGGTMALILRIYRRLIASIEELNLRWINSLLSWVFDDSEDSTASKNQLLKDLRSLNLDFFIPLGFGIVSALGVGSIVLPPLLSNYPVAMRSFFFGLILASVWIPFSMIDEGSRLNVYRMAIFFFLMLAGGYYVTNPAHQILVPVEWEKMSSTGGTLEEILNKAPSAYPAEPVFWSENNQELRKKIQNSQPEKFQTLRRSHESFSEAMLLDRDQIKSRSETYHSIQVPSEVSVYVPGIPYWYVFFAGVLAISAMILPGISGAYILLILGTYFFILNSLRGLIHSIFTLQFPVDQFFIVSLFSLGALLGILSFSRVLNYLLDQWTQLTAAALAGLMIGCLRGVWPFRVQSGGAWQNIAPPGFTVPVLLSLLMVIFGALLVFILSYIGRENAQKQI